LITRDQQYITKLSAYCYNTRRIHGIAISAKFHSSLLWLSNDSFFACNLTFYVLKKEKIQYCSQHIRCIAAEKPIYIRIVKMWFCSFFFQFEWLKRFFAALHFEFWKKKKYDENIAAKCIKCVNCILLFARIFFLPRCKVSFHIIMYIIYLLCVSY